MAREDLLRLSLEAISRENSSQGSKSVHGLCLTLMIDIKRLITNIITKQDRYGRLDLGIIEIRENIMRPRVDKIIEWKTSLRVKCEGVEYNVQTS